MPLINAKGIKTETCHIGFAALQKRVI